MRDSNRLYKFYDTLREIHMKYVPDWRFGQLISNIERAYKGDIFYLEEDEMIKLIEGYIKTWVGENNDEKNN